MNSTYYDLLEVSPKATQSVISAAYRALSQKYHPDKNNGDTQCEAIMAQINVAYAALSDPIKRKMYDQEIGVNQEKKEVEAKQPPATVEKPSSQRTTKNQQNTTGSEKSFTFIMIIFVAAAFLVIYLSKSNSDYQLDKKFQEIKSQDDAKFEKAKLKWENAEKLLTGINSAQNFQKAQNEYEEIIKNEAPYCNDAKKEWQKYTSLV